MLENRWIEIGIEIVLAIFMLYLFFLYFGIFFKKKEKSLQAAVVVLAIMVWLLLSPRIAYALPLYLKISIAILAFLLGAQSVFIGNFASKCVFLLSFLAIWMMVEIFTGNLLMIYCRHLAGILILGSLISKAFLCLILLAVRKLVVHDEIISDVPYPGILLVLIPLGSIYIMDKVFVLGYQVKSRDAEISSLISSLILLLLNVLVFYIYVKMAENQQIRRESLAYKQQLELYERHQEEIGITGLEIREVRHNMKNNLIAICSLAQRGEYERVSFFISKIMHQENLKSPMLVNTGNIVIDSLISYWWKVAEKKNIKFSTKLIIPIDMEFDGADISLILGNLLENAVEGADKVKQEKYIKLNMKYDRSNLLLYIENSYEGRLIRNKEGNLKSTKADAQNHGIGLASVRKTVKNYQGWVLINDSVPGRFVVTTILYGNKEK